MKKGITFITYIYEASIEPWHELLYFSDIDVSYRKIGFSRFALIFHQALILEQCNRNFFRLGIDNYFACHSSFVINKCRSKG